MECPICSETLDDQAHKPMGLLCGHTLCHSCMSDIAHRSGREEFPCPECRTSCTVAGARPNFALLSVLHSMARGPPPSAPLQPSAPLPPAPSALPSPTPVRATPPTMTAQESAAYVRAPLPRRPKPADGITLYAYISEGDFGSMGVSWDAEKQCLWVPRGTNTEPLLSWLPRQPGSSIG
jgi:hypothetical protein